MITFAIIGITALAITWSFVSARTETKRQEWRRRNRAANLRNPIKSILN